MPKRGAAKVSDKVNDFFVVGSSVVDVICRTSDAERVDIGGRHVEHLVCISFASKSELSGIDFKPGGSASNSAVALKGMGSSVCLLSVVGKDRFGEFILDCLKKAGIDASHVKVLRSAQTGVSIVLLLASGEKSILAFRGANNELGPSDVNEEAMRNSKRVFITSLVSDANYLLFEKILKLSKNHSKHVIFAPSITMLHSWMPRIRKLRPYFDMVIVNYEEGCYYTGKTDIKDILGALPGKVAVVMKDVDGAFAAEKGKDVFHVKAVPVKIKDTTGAGDAFSGAFTHSYYAKKSIPESLKVAAAAAALKLSHEGAQFRLGKLALNAFMKKHLSSLVVRRF